MQSLSDSLFALSAEIRYVALLKDGELSLNERPGIEHSSASETDRYEELLVNPAVLTLLQRRGDLDCGGLDHVWIRYGNFWTGLFPFKGGHLNVGIEPQAQPLAFEDGIRRAMAVAGLAA
jgi:hypothetical protein